MSGQRWLAGGPDDWTLRYLQSQPLWRGALAALAMLMMQRLGGRKP